MFVWEVSILSTLLLCLEGVLIGESVDSWVWRPEKMGVFSVKSCYTLLENMRLLEETLSTEKEVVFVGTKCV
jgi:hypothetical protein